MKFKVGDKVFVRFNIPQRPPLCIATIESEPSVEGSYHCRVVVSFSSDALVGCLGYFSLEKAVLCGDCEECEVRYICYTSAH